VRSRHISRRNSNGALQVFDFLCELRFLRGSNSFSRLRYRPNSIWPTHLIRIFAPPHSAITACLGTLLAMSSTAALAQSPTNNMPGVSTPAMLQMVLGLLLVIGVLFLGAFFLRKINGGLNFGNAGPMRVVGGLMISTRERIVLVEIGDEWIVIGVVPGQIKTLHTLPKGELPVSNAGDKPFAQWLKQFSERKHESP